jgi:hypothetical protein
MRSKPKASRLSSVLVNVPGDDDGSGLCVVQMGYKLLRPDCAPPGLQARHPRWLDLARSRHQRASRRLAGGEIEGGKGIRRLLEAAVSVFSRTSSSASVVVCVGSPWRGSQSDGSSFFGLFTPGEISHIRCRVGNV